MKTKVWCSYIFIFFLLVGCASKMDEYKLVAHPQEAALEQLLVNKLASLSDRLLADPYFAQGSFDYASPLLLTSPNIDIDIPIVGDDLQNIIAKSFAKSAWFDIRILDPNQSAEALESRQEGYILQTDLQQSTIENQDPQYNLGLKLIDNSFNTVEIYVFEEFPLNNL